MENNLEQQLMGILSDPGAMETIRSVARSLSGTGDEAPAAEDKSPSPANSPQIPLPPQLSALSGSREPDPRQQALLQALRPYLTRERVKKLETAMQAAKMARLASGLLRSGGLSFLTGR